MSFTDKVIWSEGMFLQQQHFQQHDRYLENLIYQALQIANAYYWGINKLKLDDNLLMLGKLAIAQGEGILPDGTVFSIPNQDVAPPIIDVKEGTVNKLVYLALPLKRPGITEISEFVSENSHHRYITETIDVTDSNIVSNDPASLTVGKLSLRLIVEGEDIQGYSCISLARIVEIRSDRQIVLDQEFIPPCLKILASHPLINFINEIEGLLHYRSENLIQRLNNLSNGSIAEIADFMLLQLIKRFAAIFSHYKNKKNLHPEQLYTVVIQLISELAMFTHETRRSINLGHYQHNNLQDVFFPLMAELRRSLGFIMEENAINIKLEQHQINTWIAQLNDKTWLSKYQFILAVSASLPSDKLLSLIPAQIKIAPIEDIRQLVSRALPGITLSTLNRVPRQIPYHTNFTYFLLNRELNFWQKLQQSSGIAFHMSGDFPELELQLWAIKEK